jgi:cytochrome c-type biogenesis protein CcmE
MQSRTIKVVITSAVVIGGIGLLVMSSMADAEYFKEVDVVADSPAEWMNKNLRVHGTVAAGTINEVIEGQQSSRTFYLERNGKRILVRNSGPKPDTFRDLADVTAKGKLIEENGELIIEASELSAKCPSKYEEAAASGAKHPESIPRDGQY